MYLVLGYVTVRWRNERWVVALWVPLVAGCVMALISLLASLLLPRFLKLFI
jgi:hypothetical protein